jgi:hypothetical protein
MEGRDRRQTERNGECFHQILPYLLLRRRHRGTLSLQKSLKARSKIVETQDNQRVLPQLNTALPLLEGPAYPLPVAPPTAPGQTTSVTATRGAPQNPQLCASAFLQKEGSRVRGIRDGPVRGSHGWTGGNPV